MKAYIIFLIIFTLNHLIWAQESLVSNQDILDLVKAGIGQDIIVAKIKSSKCDFDTSATTLVKLKEMQVPDKVVLAMIEKRSEPVPDKHQVAISSKPFKTVVDVERQIANHYDSKYFSVNYDRFKNRTLIKVQIELVSNYSLYSSPEKFSWHFISTFAGDGISENPLSRLVCATSSSNTWRFLKSRELTMLWDAKRLPLGTGTHDGDVLARKNEVGVAEQLCWSLEENDFQSITQAGRIDFQLGGFESLINAAKIGLLRAYKDMMSPISDVFTGEIGLISAAKNKRKVFIETSEGDCEAAIGKKLVARKFDVVKSAELAELIIQFGVERSDHEYEFGQLVEKKWGKILVYLQNNGKRSLIFKQIKKPPIFGWALENQAKGLTDDFIKKLQTIERER